MHEPVPEAHDTGPAGFVRRLERKRVACDDCEFEAAVLRGDWDASVASDPLSNPVTYELTCPDCGRVETLEVCV